MAKATGEAVYADDIQLPGMLHAKTLRSPHAHARIVSIDTSRAMALPGVHAVITVAAVDEDTANAALELIDVEYEELHAFLDPRESLERDEPQIHANRKNNNVSKHVEL